MIRTVWALALGLTTYMTLVPLAPASGAFDMEGMLVKVNHQSHHSLAIVPWRKAETSSQPSYVMSTLFNERLPLINVQTLQSKLDIHGFMLAH